MSGRDATIPVAGGIPWSEPSATQVGGISPGMMSLDGAAPEPFDVGKMKAHISAKLTGGKAGRTSAPGRKARRAASADGVTTTLSVNGGPEITIPPGGLQRAAAALELGASIRAAKNGATPKPAGRPTSRTTRWAGATWATR